jgi:hypothetical protein
MSFDLFWHRRIAVFSWVVHDLFYLEVCSWGHVSEVLCCPFFQDGWSSFVSVLILHLVFQRSLVLLLWLLKNISLTKVHFVCLYYTIILQHTVKNIKKWKSFAFILLIYVYWVLISFKAYYFLAPFLYFVSFDWEMKLCIHTKERIQPSTLNILIFTFVCSKCEDYRCWTQL